MTAPTGSYQLPQSYARAEYVLALYKLSSRTGNGGSPYGNLPTTTMLRSGIICFDITNYLHELGLRHAVAINSKI